MIVVVDYGMGNLRSVWKAVEQTGIKVKVSDQPEDIQRATGIIVPGVGAFAAAMRNLKQRGLLEPLIDILKNKRKPFLGICLGLQLLMDTSEEDGPVEGFKIIPGDCKRFRTDLKVPHMGWNQVQINNSSILFDGIDSSSYFYFVHSYFVAPRDRAWVRGETEYEEKFCSAISDEKQIFAVQFHPEKSQQKGLRLLDNFSNIVKNSTR